jgi:ribosomal protein S18 acetylase RimI-like enzyme
MLHNPLHVALLGGSGETERQEIERMFLELFETLPGIVFLSKEEGRIVGVMRMNSCVGKKTGGEQIPAGDEGDVQYRKSVWQGEWARRDPKEQHWHLGPIGVLPTHRKSGIGTRLMERFCAEADNCAAFAYLETDLDENVRFYEKFGFSVIARSDIFQVENRYMVREARERNGQA